MVLTMVDCAPDADTWFPQWDETDWRLESERTVVADERNQYDFTVRDWRRVSVFCP
jgi:hypothetical protein